MSKIMYVSRAMLPSVISNSLSIMKMCQAFVDSGNKVNLIGYRPCRNPVDVIKYYGLKGGFIVNTWYYNKILTKLRFHEYLYSQKVRKIVNNLKPDLVYSRLCLLELRNIPSDVPIIYEMHSPGPVNKTGYQRGAFHKLLHDKNIRRIVVTTNALKTYLTECFPDVDIVIARLSAEKPFIINQTEITNFKERTIKGNNRFNVGYTGALDNTGLRGIGVICEIAKKMPHINFHIIGGGEDLVRHWSRNASSKNIYFYGHQNPAVIPYYLKSLDVMLAPLQYQKDAGRPLGKGMSPLKVPQYLAYSCPFVASDVPAHLEILDDGVNALICESNNIDQWVSKIELLLSNDTLREKISRNAYQSYLKEFTPEIRIEKVLSGIAL